MKELSLDKPYSYAGKSNYVWILDCGHGGVTPDGHYTTKPYLNKEFGLWETKMHIHKDGTRFLEGVWNRKIGRLLQKALTELEIDWVCVYDEVDDLSLPVRVNDADAIYWNNPNAILVSIHSDKISLAKTANPQTHDDFVKRFNASGFSIYTCVGQTMSDKVASHFIETYMNQFPDFEFKKDLSDGDADKESDFYILKKTDCPALLIENLNYDNEEEVKFLLSQEGQLRIVNAIVQSIRTCETKKPV